MTLESVGLTICHCCGRVCKDGDICCCGEDADDRIPARQVAKAAWRARRSLEFVSRDFLRKAA